MKSQICMNCGIYSLDHEILHAWCPDGSAKRFSTTKTFFPKKIKTVSESRIKALELRISRLEKKCRVNS